MKIITTMLVVKDRSTNILMNHLTDKGSSIWSNSLLTGLQNQLELERVESNIDISSI